MFSLLAVVALGVLYEWLRVFSAGVDRRIALTLAAKDKGKSRGAVSGRSTPDEESSEGVGLLSGARVFQPGYVGVLTPKSFTYAESWSRVPVPVTARALRASLYGATIFLSFFLMLIFMTYNVSLPLPHHSIQLLSLLPNVNQAYLIVAVVVGAAIGNYVFSPTLDVDAVLSGGANGKSMACH